MLLLFHRVGIEKGRKGGIAIAGHVIGREGALPRIGDFVVHLATCLGDCLGGKRWLQGVGSRGLYDRGRVRGLRVGLVNLLRTVVQTLCLCQGLLSG